MILILARVLFAIVAPVVAAEQSEVHVGAIAAYATWSDIGLAAGAFIGFVGMEWGGYRLTYTALGALTIAATAWFALARAAPPPPAPA